MIKVLKKTYGIPCADLLMVTFYKRYRYDRDVSGKNLTMDMTCKSVENLYNYV